MTNNISTLSRFKGSLFGLACGDAVGSKVEWKTRAWCKLQPVLGMEGSKIHRLKPGEFTDDTSMALCLAISLIEKGFDPKDQIERYLRWREEGYLGSQGRCIGIGNTVSCSLDDYLLFGHGPLDGPTGEFTAGNGSIMRLAPVPMYAYPNADEAINLSMISSKTTHGAPEAVYGAGLFGYIIFKALLGYSKENILFDNNYFLQIGNVPKKIETLANGGYKDKFEAEIDGNGYVADSLEAALWCFLKTDSYQSAVLTAANLGGDADTTAAIVGQLAGAYYGIEAIPQDWLDVIDMKTIIDRFATELYNKNEPIA